jgi:hypothetical protein
LNVQFVNRVAGRAALARQLEQTEAAYASDVLKDLAAAEQKEGELAQQFIAAAHKAAETELTTPIAGVVQRLAIHSVGGVVTPAEELMTIVPDAAPAYVAHIALDRTTLLVDGRAEPITPGMAVTAEIRTSRRRVIDYLLSPLREYAHDGMRER